MRRFKNILMVGSGRTVTSSTLASAAELAQQNGASLTLFDVVPQAPHRRRTRARDFDRELTAAQDRLEELRGYVAAMPSPRIHLGLATGTPFIEIIKRVDAFDHDLVIIAPDPPHPRSRLSQATTATQLLRKCPVPVWFEAAASSAPVAVALGPFDEPGQPNSLNTTLIELGSSLAAARGGTLNVIHAWQVEGESLLQNRRLALSPQEVAAITTDARHQAARHVAAVLDTVATPNVPYETHLLKGDPAVAIPSFIDNVQPSVVVMGMTPRTGLQRAVIGSTTERILGSIQTSILAVKPEGFVSPLTV